MSEYDTTALVEDVKERASLPDNDLRFTSAKVLSAATKELREGVATMLAETRAEHLVYSYDTAATSGTAAYRMPSRAIGGSLRDVVWVDSGGNAQPPLQQLSSDEPQAIRSSDGTPYAYYVRNYHVVLVPTPNAAGTVRMPYYARPNRLVATAAVVVAADVNRTGTAWTVVINGSPPATLENNTDIDVVRATPGFETLAAGVPATVSLDTPSAGFTTYEFTAAADAGIVAGDYICVAGEAPVPQVPVELHGLLAARTARRLLLAVGDENWQALDVMVTELEGKARQMLSPRVSGDTQQAGGSIGSNGLVAGLFGPAGWW